MGVILFKKVGVKGDYCAYGLFLIVFVLCIEIYADHCTIWQCKQFTQQPHPLVFSNYVTKVVVYWTF